ncbi:MAG: response regulator [Planctomycetia bacterium]
MKKSHGNPVSFHQGCPVCGRLLNIGVTLLGRRVYCQHCGGGFIAADPSAGPAIVERSRDRRVEDLIERAEVALQQAAESTDAEAGWAASE